MILADTSVWVDHLRVGDQKLSAILNSGLVVTHPFVLGELALGHLRRRAEIFDALKNLPKVHQATEEEVLIFIDRHALSGIGIAYIDAHLLAAARLTHSTRIWTRDKRLRAAAAAVGLAADV